IKGSGAMFGFDDLAAFTHNLENAFDEVRKGRLTVTPELVALTLSALDQIRAMVEEEAGERTADPIVCAEILTRLRALTKTNLEAAANGSPEPGPKAAVDPRKAAGSGGGDRTRCWRIRFAPGPDLMRSGSDPLLLLRELAGMGSLTACANLEEIPELAQLEPERCYVRWELALSTEASEDAIRDVFIFVEDQCELAVEAAGAGTTGAASATDSGAQSTPCPGDVIARALEESRK